MEKKRFMIYFTADLHFGHENIIKQCKRPFNNVGQMDSELIKNWNSVINTDDEVYILGDFTMKSAHAAHGYFSALNGKKYLIAGNHDIFTDEFEMYYGDLEWIKDYYKLSYKGMEFVLFHYPVLEWENKGSGSIHLYGHVHNNKKWLEQTKQPDGRCMNVGVDVNDYLPVSIERIIDICGGK